VLTVSAGWRQSRFLQRHRPVRRDIGFTDNSNPFYLFSKLNAGLLLWAPFAPTMRAEHPLLIALEAERWTFMPISATAKPGIVSSLTQNHSSQIAALPIDERLTNLRLRGPNSSKNIVSLLWEDAE
jgi:hypothetical protein